MRSRRVAQLVRYDIPCNTQSQPGTHESRVNLVGVAVAHLFFFVWSILYINVIVDCRMGRGTEWGALALTHPSSSWRQNFFGTCFKTFQVSGRVPKVWGDDARGFRAPQRTPVRPRNLVYFLWDRAGGRDVLVR
jgi:hypothetical protein